ncbi:MAG: carbohydrate binding family 9 domain-containing protein [Acidobacteria bacterium]|nr:carbohydrate binding family 9 domain-containing protein [Acidobacteriota bacterium]
MTEVNTDFAETRSMVQFLFVICWLFAAAEAVAQDKLEAFKGRPVLTAVRLEENESINVDGNQDESAWQRAKPAADFRQMDPANGEAATERTEVRILFDRRRLYLSVLCLDSEPDKLMGNTLQRDQPLNPGDRFMWSFDTFLNQRGGYFFEINPSGAMGDGLIVPAENTGGLGAGLNKAWDGIWVARVRRSRLGWSAEIEIPFASLNFDSHAPAWGANFQRTVRRKDEESLWTGWARNQGVRKMSNAGLIVGITEVSQGVGLDVKPYLVGSFAESPGRGVSSKLSGDAGIDFFYSLTPQLKSAFTINTDFAETEVDQRRVNLTRFPLFFPEKREFFIDGLTFFDFSREPDNSVVPFFSRRIGLDENGQPQKIDYGIKMTGQAGRMDVGLLQVRTASSKNLPGEDFTVLRGRQRFLRQSYLGGIYTRRDARSRLQAPAQQTLGADFLLATSRLRGSQNLEFSGFLVRNTDPLDREGGAAWGLRLDYPNDLWSGRIAFRELQEHFAPAVGFTERNSYRRLNPVLAFSPRPKNHPWIRRFSFQNNLELFYDLDNRLITRKLDLTLLDLTTQSLDNIQFHVAPTGEYLDRNFTVRSGPSSGITLLRGNEYQFTRYWIQGTTTNRRLLAPSFLLGRGTFYSGHRREFSLGMGVRPRPGMLFELNGEWNRIELKEGKFSTRLLRATAYNQFSPWISVVNYLQYDSVSRVLGWQSRFRWILRPGNDVYLVYQHNWLDAIERLSALDRSFATKITYTHRF